MQLTSENYYSQEANQEYMSVSGYKDFAGTYGKMPCEFYGMEKLNGRWQDEKSTALLVGSYVDSYFEGSLDQFKKDNPEIFTQKGQQQCSQILQQHSRSQQCSRRRKVEILPVSSVERVCRRMLNSVSSVVKKW